MWIWLLLAVLPSTRADAEYWLSAPVVHILLSGDTEVLYGIPSSGPDLRLQLVRIGTDGEKLVAKRDVPRRISKGKIIFPCGIFERAGQFIFKLITVKENKVLAQTENLDVRWPEVTVHVPLMVETYSSDVLVQLFVEELRCKPRSSYSVYMDLVYEGAAFTAWNEPTTLTSKELVGWIWDPSFDAILECEFFDKAGNYTVRIRTGYQNAPEVAVSDTILVMWSHRYSVSVAKSSVQPCHGSLSVIYHYPRCILDQDRIRVYGKALRGPLKYIRESRIESGKHATKLSCDIFDDEFHEYCFSFVSTARNGAVYDLKTHCLPTLTDNKGLIATWNDWGPWSECSSSCGNGVQTRYRFCVSPTNSSTCNGKAVQSQSCKKELCPDDSPTTTQEPFLLQCSCGCDKNITEKLLFKLLVSHCETEVIWIIQAWPSGHITVDIVNLVFPSPDYWLTIRDGRSPLGTVLAIVRPFTSRYPIHSLTDTLRLEVHYINSSTLQDIEIVCLATRSERPRESLAMVQQNMNTLSFSNLSAVHVTIIMLATIICSTIALLIIFHFWRQYKVKSVTESSRNLSCPELQTSTSELSIKSPSASPEDYLYNSFIFRSSTSLQPKLKWDKLPAKVEHTDTSSPVRRRGRPTNKSNQRESATPLTASVSELSTTGSEDGLEYDYYDYGCHQEPGSFFCPDPVLLGWPPFIPLPPQGMEEFGDYPLQQFTPSPDHS
ncbi:thrombospondin type-1 domain-containing protein 1-like [Stegodyphus dumicola]|uniref:thrombospondin type-1 domain-containing protein 1-like n=1 Tax=Stegodyphus dumicola TaxID=202533 RepID=UPI0015AFF9E2|nr:thrombospondin type-1 domain-containing protein 1-like [Stegodyphus dumicola]